MWYQNQDVVLFPSQEHRSCFVLGFFGCFFWLLFLFVCLFVLVMRVNLQSPFWVKLFCLRNKWSSFRLFPQNSLHSMSLEVIDRGWTNQTPHKWTVFHWLTIGSIWKQLFKEVPNIISNTNVYSKQTLAQGWQHVRIQSSSTGSSTETTGTTASCLNHDKLVILRMENTGNQKSKETIKKKNFYFWVCPQF